MNLHSKSLKTNSSPQQNLIQNPLSTSPAKHRAQNVRFQMTMMKTEFLIMKKKF